MKDILIQQGDEALTDSQKEKQVIKVELDDQSFSMDNGEEEEISKDLVHIEVPDSIAKGKKKRDRKAPQGFGFEDMVYFALLADNRDPSCIQDSSSNVNENNSWMTVASKEVELLLGKEKKAVRCKWVYKNK